MHTVCPAVLCAGRIQSLSLLWTNVSLVQAKKINKTKQQNLECRAGSHSARVRLWKSLTLHLPIKTKQGLFIFFRLLSHFPWCLPPPHRFLFCGLEWEVACCPMNSLSLCKKRNSDFMYRAHEHCYIGCARVVLFKTGEESTCQDSLSTGSY